MCVTVVTVCFQAVQTEGSLWFLLYSKSIVSAFHKLPLYNHESTLTFRSVISKMYANELVPLPQFPEHL